MSRSLALVPNYFWKEESLGLLQGDPVGLSTYKNAWGTRGATETTKLTYSPFTQTASEEAEYVQSNPKQHWWMWKEIGFLLSNFFSTQDANSGRKRVTAFTPVFFPISGQGILHGSNHNLNLKQLCPQYQFIDFQGGRFIFFPGLSLVNRRLWYYLKVCHDTLRFHLPLLFVSWVLFGFVFTVFLKSVARLVVPVTEVFAYLSPCISFTNSQMDLCVSPVY